MSKTHLKADRSAFQNLLDLGFCLGICLGATNELLEAISCLRLAIRVLVELMTSQAAEEKESSSTVFLSLVSMSPVFSSDDIFLF